MAKGSCLSRRRAGRSAAGMPRTRVVTTLRLASGGLPEGSRPFNDNGRQGTQANEQCRSGWLLLGLLGP